MNLGSCLRPSFSVSFSDEVSFQQLFSHDIGCKIQLSFKVTDVYFLQRYFFHLEAMGELFGAKSY